MLEYTIAALSTNIGRKHREPYDPDADERIYVIRDMSFCRGDILGFDIVNATGPGPRRKRHEVASIRLPRELRRRLNYARDLYDWQEGKLEDDTRKFWAKWGEALVENSDHPDGKELRKVGIEHLRACGEVTRMIDDAIAVYEGRSPDEETDE